MLKPLPIDSILPEALRILENNSCLVIEASPGTGKTTRLPPSLLSLTNLKGREILVLEPRRLAAKYAALRVADELQTRVGELVGYQFRFENKTGPLTRLTFVTEGMLMRRLSRDPELKSVGAVVLDEFHERSIHSDVAIAYLKQLQKSQENPLRLIVMSATLNAEALSVFLDNAPILKISQPLFPVAVDYLAGPAAKTLEKLVVEAVQKALPHQGDILVFLPGMAEIRKCEQELLTALKQKQISIFLLHGDLSKQEQEQALGPCSQRKIILSTNIAETSLTVEGVANVIDCGLHKQASYSAWSGFASLSTRPISKASAIQRMGRAGRLQEGHCFRLYTKHDFDTRPAFETPEILRADLAQTVLELKALLGNFEAFPWFEKPPSQAIEAALLLLHRLGVTEKNGELTSTGKRLAQIPQHPRISRLLIECERWGLSEEGALLAGLLSEGKLFSMDCLHDLSSTRFSNDPNLKRVVNQLLSYLTKEFQKQDDKLPFCVLTGFPDRVAKKRESQQGVARFKAGEIELLFSSGGSAKVSEENVFNTADYFVTLDVQEFKDPRYGAKLKVRSVCPIRVESLFDLEPPLIIETEVLTWEKESGRISALQKIQYDQLTLLETKSHPSLKSEEDKSKVLSVLARQGLGFDVQSAVSSGIEEWIRRLAPVADSVHIEALIAKLQLASQHASIFKFKLDTEVINFAFIHVLEGHTRLSDLKQLHWEFEVLSRINSSLAAQIDRWMPAQVSLKYGKVCKVNYPLGRAPWIESRLQDFFGMAEGPSILGDRVPLTLHLNAPNKRAVQVTTDLKGFWERSYQTLRKDLSRRYPRHAWPENPLTSKPTLPRDLRNRT